MSLFNDASLVLIPSGYKEDVVYSVKPTDGSGDLTFTRASDGTRVNSQGYVERVPWNLVTYSEQFTQYPPWLTQNITRADNVTIAPNGTTTAGKIYPSTTSSNPVIYSSGISVVSGQNYAVSIYAKASGKNWIFIRTVADASPGVWFNLSTGTIGTQTSATGIIENVGNGWYRCTVIGAPTSTSGRCVYLVVDSNGSTTGTASGTDGIYIWGAQLNEGSTTKPYFPTTDRLNVPRLDYSNGCPSLLLEPQRTNLLLYSEEFDNAYWTKVNTTISGNVTSTLDPKGENTAELITTTSGTSQSEVSRTVTTVIGTSYVFTCFGKKGSGATDLNSFRVVGTGILNTVTINWDTGVISQTGSGATSRSVGNGWYQIIIPFTANSNSTILQLVTFQVYPLGVSSLRWGAQLEQGSYPTSYIPTTSASVTRVADAASKTGISSLIGQSEGVVFADFVFNGLGIEQRLGISDGTSANYNNIRITTGGTLYVLGAASSVLQYEFNCGSLTVGNHYKIALAYNTNDIVAYLNGSNVGTDNSATIGACSRFGFDNRDSTSSPLYSPINQALLFPTRLTNDQLEYLTGTSYSTYAQMATALNYTIQ